MTPNFLRRTLIQSGICLLLATALNAEPPIMDLQVGSNGELSDGSSAKRQLNFEPQNVESSASDKAVTVLGVNAIQIPFASSDSLFGRGAFTWILRCRIQNPAAAKDGVIFGRWDASVPGRVAAVVVRDGTGKTTLVTNGTGEAQKGIGAIAKALPDGKWVNVVFRYEPGKIQSVTVFDDQGSQIDEAHVAPEKVPAGLFESTIPFTIGGGRSSEFIFELSRARAWPRSLSDIEMALAVTGR